MSQSHQPTAFAILNKDGTAIRIWWANSRERAERAAKEMGETLISLYSQRSLDEIRDALTAFRQNIAFATTCNLVARLEQTKRERDILLAAIEKLSRRFEACIDGEAGAPASSIASWHDIASVATASVKCYGQPEKQPKTETAVPAIVFYPAGSLGETIDSEGGAA